MCMNNYNPRFIYINALKTSIIQAVDKAVNK